MGHTKLVSRGHAIVAERAIRTLKEALIRRLSAGVGGRRNQWHLLLPNVLAQYNDCKHAETSVTPNELTRALKAFKALRTKYRKLGADFLPSSFFRALLAWSYSSAALDSLLQSETSTSEMLCRNPYSRLS